jgi:hypothetical protein
VLSAECSAPRWEAQNTYRVLSTECGVPSAASCVLRTGVAGVSRVGGLVQSGPHQPRHDRPAAKHAARGLRILSTQDSEEHESAMLGQTTVARLLEIPDTGFVTS